MICLAIMITLNYTKLFGNISMLGFIFLLFFFFLFYNFRDRTPMLGTLTPPSPLVPQNTPKFWGVSTRPQCAFPRSHAPASRKLGGTLKNNDLSCCKNGLYEVIRAPQMYLSKLIHVM